MKALTVIGTVIAIALIVWGIWFFIFSSKPAPIMPSSDTGTSQPIMPSMGNATTQPQQSPTVAVQQIPSPQDPAVAHDFLGKIQDANEITLGGTVVASPYALQVWGDENKGGEALLEYTASVGWNLVSLGGGEWTVPDLVGAGVPQSYAEQLVAGLGNK